MQVENVGVQTDVCGKLSCVMFCFNKYLPVCAARGFFQFNNGPSDPCSVVYH